MVEGSFEFEVTVGIVIVITKIAFSWSMRSGLNYCLLNILSAILNSFKNMIDKHGAKRMFLHKYLCQFPIIISLVEKDSI